MTDGVPTALTARTDHRDWLLSAEEPLAGLQLRAGGELPGIIAAPALLELVRKSRSYGLRLARAIEARDGDEQISAWAEVEPDADGGGCNIRLSAWRSTPLPLDAEAEDEAHRAAIARDAADFTTSGVEAGMPPYLGPVASDERGLIQWVRGEALLTPEIRDILFRQQAAEP